MMLSRFARQLAPRTATLSATARLAGLRSSRHLSTLTNQDLKASRDADTASTSAADESPIQEDARSVLHFKFSPQQHPLGLSRVELKETRNFSVWSNEEVNSVQITHVEPTHWTGMVARGMARMLRFGFDLFAGFKHRTPDEAMYLNRIVFLETVAGVPGMVAGMVRHLHSLRLMRPDGGWIHTLLEEAENERMHLLTFMALKKPGPLFRAAVVVTQGVFFNAFFMAYLLNPRICHSFVGYIEEEAVKTYTGLLEEIDAGNLPLFTHAPAPPLAIAYWKLGPNAKFRDLILAVRADEANHREVNHTFAAIKGSEEDEAQAFLNQHHHDSMQYSQPEGAKVIDVASSSSSSQPGRA